MESFFLCTNCEKAKVFVHLFQKVVVSKGQSPWSPSAEGETPLSSGVFWKSLGLKTCFQSPFLQEKKFSRSNYKQRATPKSSQWEVFGSSNLFSVC